MVGFTPTLSFSLDKAVPAQDALTPTGFNGNFYGYRFLGRWSPAVSAEEAA